MYNSQTTYAILLLGSVGYKFTTLAKKRVGHTTDQKPIYFITNLPLLVVQVVLSSALHRTNSLYSQQTVDAQFLIPLLASCK